MSNIEKLNIHNAKVGMGVTINCNCELLPCTINKISGQKVFLTLDDISSELNHIFAYNPENAKIILLPVKENSTLLQGVEMGEFEFGGYPVFIGRIYAEEND
jgi:hypothetical protein